jgi:prophage tail gpP-like protein
MAITLEVKGKKFEGWHNVEITASIKEVARSFSLQTFQDLALDIKAQDECKIYINKKLFITGYIEITDLRFDANGTGATFSGRSKTADFIDCSPEIKGNFKNKNIIEVAKILAAPYGISVKSNVDFKKIPLTAYNQGESCFDYLSRIAEKNALVLTTNEKGDLLITKAAETDSNQKIDKQSRIISAGSVENWADRFSEYVVKGQSDKKSTQTVFKDSGVKRNRKKIVTDDTNTDDTSQYAENIALRTAGQGLSANVTLAGFNFVYEPNTLIFVSHEYLRLDQNMLIEGVRYSVDNNGSQIQIDLIDPQAYGGKPSKVNKSGKKMLAKQEEKNSLSYREQALKKAAIAG